MATTGALLIKFGGWEAEEVDDVHTGGDLPVIDTGYEDYCLARDRDTAGYVVRERWRDMRDNDRTKLRALLGDDRLIQWGLGESDSFGISSFDEFLERFGDSIEEELATYDGDEIEAEVNIKLATRIGWEVSRKVAMIDHDSLGISLRNGDIEIPAELRSIHVHLPSEDMTKEESDLWVAILLAAEGSDSLDADGSIGDILDTFRFVSCVAYRQN